jgi:hypothetical protein
MARWRIDSAALSRTGPSCIRALTLGPLGWSGLRVEGGAESLHLSRPLGSRKGGCPMAPVWEKGDNSGWCVGAGKGGTLTPVRAALPVQGLSESLAHGRLAGCSSSRWFQPGFVSLACSNQHLCSWTRPVLCPFSFLTQYFHSMVRCATVQIVGHCILNPQHMVYYR